MGRLHYIIRLCVGGIMQTCRNVMFGLLYEAQISEGGIMRQWFTALRDHPHSCSLKTVTLSLRLLQLLYYGIKHFSTVFLIQCLEKNLFTHCLCVSFTHNSTLGVGSFMWMFLWMLLSSNFSRILTQKPRCINSYTSSSWCRTPRFLMFY